jgi:hypothetical protein
MSIVSPATWLRVVAAATGRNLVGTVRAQLIRVRQHPRLPLLDADRYITTPGGKAVERILAGRAQKF